MLLDDFTRREPGTVPLGEPFQIGHDALRSEVVGIPERPATERRKAESEDRADVTIARAPDDALAERPCCFIHHAEHEALQNLGRTRAAIRVDTEEVVRIFVHAPPLAALVEVETAACLAAEAPL